MASSVTKIRDNRENQGKRRTQAERSEEMQGRLKQAAYELVAKGGLGALRIASVAEHAGVSQGAVLHHFANKDKITLAAIEQALTLAHSESAAWDQRENRPAELLNAMLDEFQAFFFSDRFWVAIGITLEFSKGEGLSDLLANKVAALRQPVYAAWTERLCERGWQEQDAAKLVRSAAALISGIAIRRLWSAPDDIADQILEDWFENALSLLKR